MPLNHRLNFAKYCTVFSSFTHNLSEYSPLLETEVYREHSSMLNQRNWGWSKITFIFLSENLKWRVSCMQNNMLGPFIFYGHFFWRYYLCLVNVESETLNFLLSFILWHYIWRVDDTWYRLSIWSRVMLCFSTMQTLQMVTLARDTSSFLLANWWILSHCQFSFSTVLWFKDSYILVTCSVLWAVEISNT